MIEQSGAVSAHIEPSARMSFARRLWVLAPEALVAFILVLSARAYYVGWRYTGLVGFAELGSSFARHVGLQALAGSPIGYDGQFAYYIARQPSIIFSCAIDTATCPLDNPMMRAQRILYPMLARLVALGQPTWIPFTLLLLNFVAVLAVATLVSAMCVELGASRWWGAAAGLFTGEVLGFVRDLNDPFGVLWSVLALYLLRKRHPLWAAAAAGAALLSREQLIVFVPLLTLPLIAERRWGTLALAALIALVPFGAWELALRIVYGQWAFASSASTAGLVPLPFAGLWQARGEAQFAEVILTGALPVALGIFAGALALWQSGWRRVLLNPIPLMTLSYCLFASLMSVVQWADVFGPARLAAPGVIVGIFAVCRLKPPLGRAFQVVYALALIPMAVLLTLVACLQIV